MLELVTGWEQRVESFHKPFNPFLVLFAILNFDNFPSISAWVFLGWIIITSVLIKNYRINSSMRPSYTNYFVYLNDKFEIVTMKVRISQEGRIVDPHYIIRLQHVIHWSHTGLFIVFSLVYTYISLWRIKSPCVNLGKILQDVFRQKFNFHSFTIGLVPFLLIYRHMVFSRSFLFFWDSCYFAHLQFFSFANLCFSTCNRFSKDME